MNRTIPQASGRSDAWRAHLQEVFREVDIPAGPVADHVAASIAAYCGRYHPLGLSRSDLVLLVARAFCAINDRATAARALASMRPHARHAERWLEVLSELHHFPALLPYFSRGIIRPADWAGANLDRMWTLDFGRLAMGEAERHEMVLYRSIRLIIDNMLYFWDATGGEGVLGLKGLQTLRIDGGAARPADLTETGELMDYVAGLLGRQRAVRGWHAVPGLINLDLK